MKKLLVCAATLAVPACVGDGVEFGGVDKPLEPTANAVACASATMRPVSRPPPKYPPDAVMFYFAAQRNGQIDDMRFTFDVNESGETANIRFVGAPQMLRHSTRQTMVRASAEAIAGWTHEWVGQPRFAVGCNINMNYYFPGEEETR